MGAIWAVARLTLTECARRRTPLALVLLALVAGPALSMFLEGDQRLEGLLKTVMTWIVALVSGAMMLLMLFLSSNALGRDIAGKQAFMTDSKPVHRWQVFAGKWLGINLLSAWLLLIAWGTTFLVVFCFSAVGRVTMAGWGAAILGWGAAGAGGVFLVWLVAKLAFRRKWWIYPAWLAVLAALWMMVAAVRAVPIRHDARAADSAAVRERLLVARRSFRPPTPDADKAAERRYQELLALTNREPTPEEREQIKATLRDDVQKRTWRIPFVGLGYSMSSGTTFTIKDIPPEAIRYAPELVVRYKFYLRRGANEGGNGFLYWRFPLRSGGTMVREGRFKSGASDEIVVDSNVVLANGEMDIQIINANPPEEPAAAGEFGPAEAKPAGIMFVPLREGLEVLVPVGRFDANLARGFLLLWIRMAMIVLVGLAANTFLSGPVTAFFLFFFLVLGAGNAFWLHQMLPNPDLVKAGVDIPSPTRMLMLTVAESVLSLAPNFVQTDPSVDLVVGREIPWSRVLWQALMDVGLRGGVCAALGLFIFTRREIAKPTSV